MSDSNFESRAKFIGLWLQRSEELFKASQAVWNSDVIIDSEKPDNDSATVHMLYRPATLLMGLCLEALLKGLLIQRDPALINGEKFPEELKTHSLENLFGLADLELTNEEQKGIKRWTEAILWDSKYAVPLTSENLKAWNGVRCDGDFYVFSELRNKVLALYENEPSLGRFLT